MATIRRELTAKKDGDGKAEFLLRFTIRRGLQWRLHTSLRILPELWDDEDKRIRFPRLDRSMINELRQLDETLKDIESLLYKVCETDDVSILTREKLEAKIADFLRPQIIEEEEKAQEKAQEKIVSTFFDYMHEFIEKRRLSEWRKRRYHVLLRALKRYEHYRRLSRHKDPILDVKTFSADDLLGFETFLRNEHEIYEIAKYKVIYKKNPADTRPVSRKKVQTNKVAQKKVRTREEEDEMIYRGPQKRGDNTIFNMFSCLRSFFKELVANGVITSSPFQKYHGIVSENYGTPYYITLDERNIIADHDFSKSPSDALQRDIFIFQTLIGCRVSDLYRMTPKNIINGAIEYIASKTLNSRAKVIRVPLNQRGLEILDRYKGQDPEGRIFPFISQQKYNVAIKRIFKECGITRLVTILNPTTGQEEQRPINEVASSHIARRTFVGNLYKKVKDPSLVGALSGHKDGSRAFARYREIDDDLKKEMIGYLD